MRKYVLIIFIQLFLVFIVKGLDAPSLRCIEVLQNGSIKITWVPPADPTNDFVEYKIYKSTDGVTFSLVSSSSPITNIDFIDATANGNSVSTYFYISSLDKNGKEFNSDTLQSIFTEVKNKAPLGTGFAQITWNSIHSTKLATTDNSFQVMKDDDQNGTFFKTGVTQYSVLGYSDTKKHCEADLSFQIEIKDASACKSISNVAQAIIKDELPPNAPKTDSVSVDYLNNKINISWKPDNSGDIGAYVIIRDGLILDTIFGINNTTYTDTKNLDTENKSYEYTIASFDTCWTGNPPKPNQSVADVSHKSILLEGEFDACSQQTKLSWSTYEGFGVASYDIYWSVDKINFSKVGTTQTIDFTHKSSVGDNYYYVRANSNSTKGSSSSNLYQSKVSNLGLPKILYVASVDIVAKNHAKIKCAVDKDAKISKYDLYVKDLQNPKFVKIATYTKDNSDIIIFDDIREGLDTTINYYKIVAFNECGYEITSSNISNNILLKVKTDRPNFANDLFWNEITVWDTAKSGTFGYEMIYSQEETFSNFITKDAKLDTVYKHQFFTPEQKNTNFCYKVTAKEGSGNKYGLNEVINSNVVCVKQAPLVYIPSSFTPGIDGVNDVFKVESVLINSNNFEFSIFNRNGTLIFKTNDINQGWDGKVKNQVVKQGVYIYVVTFDDLDGQTQKQVGRVLVSDF